MRLLTFQAKRFRWRPYTKTLPDAPEQHDEREVTETVVVFFEAERNDQDNASVMRQTVKHIKWLANKKQLRRIVLHSFTHLGGDTAPPEFAGKFLRELGERLENSGYEVAQTPFGYFCEWDISVYGDSLAKVWKQI
jgi:hypothetical protein